MKHNIFSVLKTVALASVLSIGISYVSAWTSPTATPPNGNVAAPINVGSTAQTKSGSLNIIRGPISADTELGSYGVSGASSGVGYVTVGRGGSNNGGFLGWDYTNSGIALNAHSAGGSVGGLFVKRADNAHSNVGIGTVNPGNAFDVVGSSYLSGTVNAQDVYSRDAGKWMSQLGGGVTSLTAGSGISLSGSTGAVTVSSTGGGTVGVYSATDLFVPNSGSWSVISSLPITTNGAAVTVTFSDWIHDTNGNVSTMLWRVARDGITVWDSIIYNIQDLSLTGGFYLNYTFMDTPSAGNHTYTIEVKVPTGGTSSLHGKRGIFISKN